MKNLLSSYYLSSKFLQQNFISSYNTFVIPVLIIIILLNCTKYNENVLAIIERPTVTIGDFINRNRSIREKMNLPDNGQVRKEIFRAIIDEELLITEAIKKGYGKITKSKFSINN